MVCGSSRLCRGESVASAIWDAWRSMIAGCSLGFLLSCTRGSPWKHLSVWLQNSPANGVCMPAGGLGCGQLCTSLLLAELNARGCLGLAGAAADISQIQAKEGREGRSHPGRQGPSRTPSTISGPTPAGCHCLVPDLLHPPPRPRAGDRTAHRRPPKRAWLRGNVRADPAPAASRRAGWAA